MASSVRMLHCKLKGILVVLALMLQVLAKYCANENTVYLIFKANYFTHYDAGRSVSIGDRLNFIGLKLNFSLSGQILLLFYNILLLL